VSIYPNPPILETRLADARWRPSSRPGAPQLAGCEPWPRESCAPARGPRRNTELGVQSGCGLPCRTRRETRGPVLIETLQPCPRRAADVQHVESIHHMCGCAHAQDSTVACNASGNEAERSYTPPMHERPMDVAFVGDLYCSYRERGCPRSEECALISLAGLALVPSDSRLLGQHKYSTPDSPALEARPSLHPRSRAAI